MKLNLRAFFIATSFISAISVVTLFSACNKKVKLDTDNSLQLKISDATDNCIFDVPVSHPVTNKKLVVLLGYGFNSPEISKEYRELLEERFSVVNENNSNGLIQVLTYPDDFKRTGRSFATEFYNFISSESIDLCGIVTLGAPEYTHTALARNQDKWNEAVPYPVISLFPQDDVLGIESTNDFVLDKGQSIEISDEIPEESPVIHDKNAQSILVNVINYIEMSDSAFCEISEAHSHAAQILKDSKFHNYTDPETGLKAINHFVLD